LTVNAYFDIQLAFSHKVFFISTNAPAANAMHPIVGKSKMLKNSGLLSFAHAYKKWKYSMRRNFVCLRKRLYLGAMSQYMRYNYWASRVRTHLWGQFH